VPVQVSPIGAPDVRAAGEFLHANLNADVSAETWARATDVPWSVEQPNSGFMLVDDGTIVGVYLAFYSERPIDGRRERFCNLGAWCVRPEYRFHGLRLLKALLAQDGFTFTDLSPSGGVPELNARLGFSFLDTTTWLVPNLPWPSIPRRTSVSSDPATIAATLSGAELAVYEDHAAAGAARHVVLRRGDEWCYVVFRKDRRKGLALFASILHVSDPERFHRFERPLARHLLLRHGAVATLVEQRLVSYRPQGALVVRSPRRKMYRSPRLKPAQIDYLYSELVCVPW
jgi:hypothetical protein